MGVSFVLGNVLFTSNGESEQEDVHVASAASQAEDMYGVEETCLSRVFFCRSRGGSSFSSQPVVTRGDGKANGVREYVSGELESGGLSLQKSRHVQKGRKRRPCT